MTYTEAQSRAIAGKRVRHSKMGDGWVMIYQGGKFVCVHPSYSGRSSPDAHDRNAKDWEVVG